MANKLQYCKGRLIVFIIFPFLFSCTALRYYDSGIKYHPDLKYEGRLHNDLPETSGIEYFNNKFWSFNDSGGEPNLYSFIVPSKIDISENIEISKIDNAENIDWEDITQDSLNFYIADVGNNYGSRDTMLIYRLPKNEAQKDVASADAIFKIVFSEKTESFSNCFRNPFDCEGLIFKNDSLFLFTKNWQDKSSWIYKIPAVPGIYDISRSKVLQPRMLVTGAYYDMETNLLWLIGYRSYKPVVSVYNFKDTIGPSPILRIKFSQLIGLQTEGICKSGDRIYFSFEKSRKKQGLYSINSKLLNY